MPITKQTIAIIGAGGNRGSVIAQRIAGDNYRLLLFDSAPEKLDSLAEKIRQVHSDAIVESMSCAYECSWEADIIILAVPRNAEKEIAEKIQDVATQKIVITVVNSIDEDFSKLTAEPDTSAAGELQQLLPHSKVVNAAITITETDTHKSAIKEQKMDTFVTGNDEEAIETVTKLIETMGFNPVFAGDLSA